MSIERADAADEEFIRRCVAQSRPVIILGATRKWRAARDWVTAAPDGGVGIDVDHLERHYGDGVVRVTDTAARHRGAWPTTEQPLREFCAWWRATRGGAADPAGRLLYVKDWHFAARHPEYVAYEGPSFFEDWLNEWSLSSTSSCTDTADYRFVYLGAAGTSTPLHSDVLRSHSWSVNVAGRKRWRLLAPEHRRLVVDARGDAAPDFDDADAGRFPGLARARRLVVEVVQEAGEAIVVPSGWLHTVDNLTACLSINHNVLDASSAPAAAAHLRAERAAAAAAIADCVALARPFEFEALVQRNVAASAGMSYADLADMLRFVCRREAAALAKLGAGEREDGERAAQLRAAHAVLAELLQEQEGIYADCAARSSAGGGGPEPEGEALAAEIADCVGCCAAAAAALAAHDSFLQP